MKNQAFNTYRKNYSFVTYFVQIAADLQCILCLFIYNERFIFIVFSNGCNALGKVIMRRRKNCTQFNAKSNKEFHWSGKSDARWCEWKIVVWMWKKCIFVQFYKLICFIFLLYLSCSFISCFNMKCTWFIYNFLNNFQYLIFHLCIDLS